MDAETKIQILLKALEMAPFPIEWQLSSMHPEDVQKWSDRYQIWYKEVRCFILDSFEVEYKNNLYYQFDRLIQDAKLLQIEIKKLNFTENKMDDSEELSSEPSIQESPKAITIGTIKSKKQT